MNENNNSKPTSDSAVGVGCGVRRFLPSNGTEGMMFTDKFCEHCINEEFMPKGCGKQCEILSNSLLHDRPCYNKDLKLDGWEWFIDENYRNAKCNHYVNFDWGNDRDGWNEPPEIIPDDPNQLILFSFNENLDELLKETRKEYA